MLKYLQGSRGAQSEVQLLREESQEQEGADRARVRAHWRTSLHLRHLQQRLQEQLRPLHAQDARPQDRQAGHQAQLREEGQKEEGLLTCHNRNRNQILVAMNVRFIVTERKKAIIFLPASQIFIFNLRFIPFCPAH